MDNKVKNIIKGIQPISNKSYQIIFDLLKFHSVSKGETFIKKNRQDHNEYFIITGVCKSYVINPEGEEITISFFLENSILSPHQIRTTNNISSLNFKALTNLQIASIDAKRFENLMIDHLDVRNFANTVLKNELKMKVAKEIGLASLNAEERLIEFRRNFLALENLIPHSDIASYLGITNISLSRLRNKLKK